MNAVHLAWQTGRSCGYRPGSPVGGADIFQKKQEGAIKIILKP